MEASVPRCACRAASRCLGLTLEEESSVSKGEFCSEVAAAWPGTTCTNTSFRKTVESRGEHQICLPEGGGLVTSQFGALFPHHLHDEGRDLRVVPTGAAPSGEVLTNMRLLHWGCVFNQARCVMEAPLCDLGA